MNLEETETTTTAATTTTAGPTIVPKDPGMYLPIYVMTGIYGAVFILAPLFVRKGPNRGIIRCCIWMSTFSLWMLWFTVYVSQMNPLLGPRLKNTTLAWISHSWGKSSEEPSEGSTDTTLAPTTDDQS
ncbi:V-type proton ATPase subunit e-like [Ostrinia nubilalis]|uniref:V-type proton ATPase subunit e-like n=1 Tax=Ostrinia furnacalis TaxID=93504 RepID=UPI00103AA133|nr:V-type proton ATPase subunit e-like [Ostrinia furnacalis]